MWTAIFPVTLESMVLRFHRLLLALLVCDRKLALSDTKEAAKYVVSRRMQVRPTVPPFHPHPFLMHPHSGRPSSAFVPSLVR